MGDLDAPPPAVAGIGAGAPLPEVLQLTIASVGVVSHRSLDVALDSIAGFSCKQNVRTIITEQTSS